MLLESGAVYYAFRACIADRFSKWAILLTRLLHLVILPKPMPADPYQGWKQVMVIIPREILYGVLVAWRRNLRPGMIAHAWSGIFEGWLKFV